jgi:hypothetical protein
MPRWNFLFAVVIACLIGGHAQAQSMTLENCPGYPGANSGTLDIAQSAACFLQAIYEKDKNVIAALAPQARCSTRRACDGPLDEDESRFVFGPRLPYYKRTMLEMITKAKSVTVAFTRDYGDIIDVTFIPRPGKKKSTPTDGWMSVFITCDFELNDEKSAWNVTHGFCFSESDRFTGGSDDEFADPPPKEQTFDFESPSSDLPIMVWKPNKAMIKKP